MERLLAWLEAHDTSTIVVRYQGSAAELKATDERLLASAAAAPGASYGEVAWMFPRGLDRSQEVELAGRIDKGLRGPIPADVLFLQSGQWMSDAERAEAERSAGPSLELRYSLAPSGAVYEDEDRRSYAGLALALDLTLRVPDGKEPLLVHLDARLPETLSVTSWKLGGASALAGDPSSKALAVLQDQRVYHRMLALLFEDVLPRTVEVFHGSPR
jgi:hypothetical protein